MRASAPGSHACNMPHEHGDGRCWCCGRRPWLRDVGLGVGGRAGQEKFKKELETDERRPTKEKVPLWRNPLVKAAAKNLFVLAVGVGLGVLLGRKPITART